MTVARAAVLWITVAVIALLVLLREILLPFAVSMALAYLLAQRLLSWAKSVSMVGSQPWSSSCCWPWGSSASCW